MIPKNFFTRINSILFGILILQSNAIFLSDDDKPTDQSSNSKTECTVLAGNVTPRRTSDTEVQRVVIISYKTPQRPTYLTPAPIPPRPAGQPKDLNVTYDNNLEPSALLADANLQQSPLLAETKEFLSKCRALTVENPDLTPEQRDTLAQLGHPLVPQHGHPFVCTMTMFRADALFNLGRHRALTVPQLTLPPLALQPLVGLPEEDIKKQESK